MPAVMSSFPVPRSLFPPLPGPWVVSCSDVVSLLVPCPFGRLPVTLSLPCPLAGVSLSAPSPPLARALSLPGVVVVGWGGGAAGPGLGVAGLEPLAEGSGGVGGAEALHRVSEEGLPCRLRHDGLRGGLVGVGGDAGAHLLEGVHHVHPFSPSHSPGPLPPTPELLQSGGRPPGEVGRGLGGGEGSELKVLEWREEDVDLRPWRAWRCLGERERRWRGLEVEDGYWRRGEQEARWGVWGERVVDMGRGKCAWRRLGGRERRRRGLGVGVGYGRRGEREARWGLWGEGVVDISAAVVRLVAPWGTGVAGAGPRGVVVAPWGAGGARVSG